MGHDETFATEVRRLLTSGRRTVTGREAAVAARLSLDEGELAAMIARVCTADGSRLSAFPPTCGGVQWRLRLAPDRLPAG